jgi:hypothetical protein
MMEGGLGREVPCWGCRRETELQNSSFTTTLRSPWHRRLSGHLSLTVSPIG